MKFENMNEALIAAAAMIPICQGAIEAHKGQIAKLEALMGAAEALVAVPEFKPDYKPPPNELRAAMEAVTNGEKKNGKAAT